MEGKSSVLGWWRNGRGWFGMVRGYGRKWKNMGESGRKEVMGGNGSGERTGIAYNITVYNCIIKVKSAGR